MEVLFLLSFLPPFLLCINTLSLLEKPSFEAIYQFGDSMADTGNIVRENALHRCGKPPYGQTFFHHPTGRCSDGRLIIDFFECKKRLGKALCIVGEIGGNDYNFAAYQGKTVDDLRALVPEVIQTITNVLKELIDLGAKRIIVPGNFPVGCMTIYLALFETDHNSTMYDELNCLRSWNEFATFHNDQLQIAITDLQKEYSDVAIVYGDYYNALTSILKHASLLGFEEDGWQKACCGSGNNNYNFDSSKKCGYDGVPACSDPNKRVSWDGVHLTQHAFELMANLLLKHFVPTGIQVA